MATLQVRSLDDALYKALGRQAERDNRSISQEVTAILKEHLAFSRENHIYRMEQLLDLAGSWEDPRSAAEMAREIHQARRTGKTRFQ